MLEMNKVSQVTDARMLKLQHASVHTKASVPFGELLNKEVGKQQNVQFSKHAAQRVQERGIEVTDGLMQGLNNAVEKARAKGAKDVVVIGENGAFIVNVPHNVVITTMAGAEMKENIFTNIDSAVLM